MADNTQNQNTSGSDQLVGTVASTQLPSNQMNVVTGDAVRLGTNVSNGRKHNAIVHFTSNLKFKKLTFYEVIHEVIRPTLLTMSGEPFEFRLLRDHINLVIFCRDIANKSKTFQYQIRIGEIVDDGTPLITDQLPPGLNIRFGFLPCQIPTYKSLLPPIEATKPINCTNLLVLNQEAINMFFIKWTPDQKNYALTMNLVRRLSVTTLLKRLKVKDGRSSEETKNYIIQMFENVDPDLVTGNPAYRFSLLCPLSKKRMKIPAKSIHCHHLQCFDAKMYLLMNDQKPTWKCPICDLPCLYEDMQIQNYFLEIVTSPTLNGYNTDIEFVTDGTWIVCGNNETKLMNSTPDTEKEPMNLDEGKHINNE